MTDVAAPKRRFITANQVTIVRILCLPYPCWALLTRPPDVIMWSAFVFGALIGMTDFVDGWLARRDGPTTLGGLLDPIADKLFVAMLLMPLVAYAECPGWAAGALFCRELLITSLRSSMAVRQTKLKTSSLGKLKTVVQMGGLAAFFLTVFVPPAAMPWSIFGCATAFLFLAVGWFIRARSVPLWLAFTPVLLYTIFGVAMVRPAVDAAFTVFMLMLFFTWVSGFDYLTGSARAFRATGGVTVPDAVRLIGGFVHGFALIPLVDRVPSIAVPVIIALCAELSLGGVENLVSAEKRRWARGSVLPTIIAAAFVGVGVRFDLVGLDVIRIAAWGLALFSVVNLGVACVLDRKVILDQPV